MNDSTTRRDLLVAGGIGLLANAVVPTADAASTAPTASEQDNIKLVKQFLDALSAKPTDIDAVVTTYFAANASVRWTGDSPPMIGSAAAIAAAKSLMPTGAWMEIKLLDVFARGPMVATSRIDVLKVPGKPDVPFGIAGVHIIKDGKIIEYIDYVIQ